MLGPVLIEKGDFICINVLTGTVWIEKEFNGSNQPWRIPPPPPGTEGSAKKRHFPAGHVLGSVKNHDAWRIAYALAYAVAWVAGLSVCDDTERFLDTKHTYVFGVK